MSDIQLFRINGGSVIELSGQSVAVEKSLQSLMEKHLETFLGVRFLASEYLTGKTHGGRIDTLGLDENHCPVIIEYKRSLNENVINQGLFYLDWLMDHRAEYKLLVMERYGKEEAEKIEWSSPRLLCIAGDFTKYDQHAVQQINRNIELLRYRKFGEELLMVELVNATTVQGAQVVTPENGKAGKIQYKTVSDNLAQAKPAMLDLYESLSAFLLSLGDDVQQKTLKGVEGTLVSYVTYSRPTFRTSIPSALPLPAFPSALPDCGVFCRKREVLTGIRQFSPGNYLSPIPAHPCASAWSETRPSQPPGILPGLPGGHGRSGR